MENLSCPNCGSTNQSTARFCRSCGNALPGQQPQTTTFAPLVDPSASRRKNRVGLIIGIVVFVALVAGAIFFFANFSMFDKAIATASEEINKSCPMMLDDETRLDNTEALPDKTLKYNYTLVNMEKADLNIDTLKKYLEPNILSNAKTSPELQIFRTLKATLVYHYIDKNGEFVHEYSVTPDMYQ